MQFINKNKISNNTNIEYDNKLITQTNFVKFLGVMVDKLSWKQYTDTIIPKLNKACFIIRRLKLYLTNYTLKMVYYAFFHSIMSYNLIFWGNSTNSNSTNSTNNTNSNSTNSKLKKQAIRIIMGAKNRDSCRGFF